MLVTKGVQGVKTMNTLENGTRDFSKLTLGISMLFITGSKIQIVHKLEFLGLKYQLNISNSQKINHSHLKNSENGPHIPYT